MTMCGMIFVNFAFLIESELRGRVY